MLEIKIFLLNSRLVMFENVFSLKLEDVSPKRHGFENSFVLEAAKSVKIERDQ